MLAHPRSSNADSIQTVKSRFVSFTVGFVLSVVGKLGYG